MKLLLPGLGRCTISWVLTAAFYVSVWGYKDRVISPRTKSGFDVVTVALSIAFGMNVASSLKGTALDLRWWVLSKKKRSSREVPPISSPKERVKVLTLCYLSGGLDSTLRQYDRTLTISVCCATTKNYNRLYLMAVAESGKHSLLASAR